MQSAVSRLPYIAQATLVALVYVAVARLSLALAIPPGYATAVWPPSGIALAAMLLFGNRCWPGVLLGAAITNLSVEASPVFALLIAGGNTLEALVAGTMIRRAVEDPTQFRRAEEPFAFIVICAASSMIAATIALVPILAGHDLAAGQAWQNWWTWWQGDFAGMIVVAPLILGWTDGEARAYPRNRLLEAGAFYALLLACALVVSSGGAPHLVTYALTFLTLPFIIWAAFRFGQREATTTVALICAVAIWYTLRERSDELAQVPLNQLLLTLLAFTSIVVATGLILVALVEERDRAAPAQRAPGPATRRSDTPRATAFEKELRHALDRQEFALHYQPKVDLDSRRIVGLEALLRWNSSRHGSVAPMHFIPLLEESGMILDVGRWALRRALLDQREWATLGLPLPRIAVNVSPIQLRQRDFVALVLDAIGPTAQSPLIDLELTESLIMENVEDSSEKLTRIHEHGIGIAIDDFGTGYSSLAYLTKLPAQTLKIDRFFIDRMLKDDQSMTLVHTIISLAQALGLTTVAEGVEIEEQADVLEMLRCDQMQGYLVSKPLPARDIAGLLKS